MHPVDIIRPRYPVAPSEFAELDSIFHTHVSHSLEKLHRELTRFIRQKNLSDAAKQAARAVQLELQQQTSQARTHWIEAERSTSFSLFLKCLQIETFIQTAQFSAINQLLKALSTMHQTDEPEALSYLAQSAVVCGLPSIVMRLVDALPASRENDGLMCATRVLQKTHTPETQLESQFLAVKDWLAQQGITIDCYGLMYSVIDDRLADLLIYANERNIERLVCINTNLDNHLSDAFSQNLPTGISISVRSTLEIDVS